MARSGGKGLTALKVRGRLKPGLHADSGRDGVRGLYLQVAPDQGDGRPGARSWLFRFASPEMRSEDGRTGKARAMGLGGIGERTLAEAREKASAARRELADGIDPLEARNRREMAQRLAAAQGVRTFREIMADCIEAKRPEWRNPKHAQQWRNTLETHAAKLLDLPIAAIDEAMVLSVLRPLWTAKTETATRLRGRIETVLDFAAGPSLRLRSGPNPARWKGNLDAVLAKPSKVRKVRHHPALPYRDAPAFLERLRAMAGTSPRALEFTILTAARSGEARGARWSEIDLDAAVWTVPETRIKSGRLHRVPLPERAVAILRTMLPLRDQRHGDYIFPGGRAGKPLSDAALSAVLDRMGRSDLTAHGFRSCFRDWAAEETSFAWQLAEAALAHVIGDETSQAYQRGDLLERRRRLMTAWANYCATKPRQQADNVVAIGQGDAA